MFRHWWRNSLTTFSLEKSGGGRLMAIQWAGETSFPVRRYPEALVPSSLLLVLIYRQTSISRP
jgi:hypothetical protein